MADFLRLVLRGGWLAALAGIWAAAMLGGGAWLLGWVWLALGLTGTGAALLHDMGRLPPLAARAPGPAAQRLRLAGGVLVASGLGLGLATGGLWCLPFLALVGLWGWLAGPAQRFRPALDIASGLVRAILGAAAGLAALAAM